MAHDALFGLWFFAPAGVANLTPVLIYKLPVLRDWKTPLDFGHQIRGHRLSGDNKTWRGVIGGMTIGTLALWLQVTLFKHSAWIVSVSRPLDYSSLPILRLGLLMSFGALAGDALKSFFKRQLSVASGHSWFPFDQLDYIIGGLLLSTIEIRLSVTDYVWVVVDYFVLHLVFSYLGFHLKLKEQPI